MASYSSEGSIGDFPTANVTVEALNMAFDAGATGNLLPSINPTDGTRITDKIYSLTGAAKHSSSDTTSVLKPGDITLSIPNTDGGISISDAKIQSYNLSVDFGREPLQRLGNRFAFAREITFPVTVSMSVDALLGDLTTGNLATIIDADKDYDLMVELKKDGTRHIAYVLKGAKLDSQEYSSTIGDKQVCKLFNFSAQVGAKTETTVGLFMSGVNA